jgi:YD repeat-containing protein
VIIQASVIVVPLTIRNRRRIPRPPPTARSTRRVRGRDEGVAGARAHKDEAPRHRESAREGAPYQYDALGNLLGVWLPNGDVVEYLVDGLGRRVGKKLNGVGRASGCTTTASSRSRS